MEYRPFSEIAAAKLDSGEPVVYKDELTSLEWQNKRTQIVERDEGACTGCGALPTEMIDRRPYRKKTEQEAEAYATGMRETYKDLISSMDEFFKSLIIPMEKKFLDNLSIPLNATDKHIVLHVHHKYYVYGRHAWEYPDDALVTLCQSCHQDVHNSSLIPVYEDEKRQLELNVVKCPKCNGSGYLNKYYYHLDGICFGCEGNRYIGLRK